MNRLMGLLNEDVDFLVLDDSPLSISKHKYNLRNIWSLCSNLRLIKSSDIIHIHSGNWILRIVLIVIAKLFRKKIIVTLHSYRLVKIRKYLTNKSLFLTNKIICVNERIANDVKIKDKCIVKEAFLPPTNHHEDVLPEEIDRFLIQNRERFILCANASKLVEFNGKDLYGLDQCIEVAKLAKKQKTQLSIIFVIGIIDELNPLFQSYTREIADHSLGKFIKLYPKSLSFITLIQKCDVVLRPTLSDGDALTVREALFFNKVVIASDVVKRPRGTVLYKTGDALDLYKKIQELMASKITKDSSLTNNTELTKYNDFYLQVYNGCSK